MKRVEKRILIIGMAIVCIFAVCVGLGIQYITSRPIWQLEQALGKGDYQTVQALYEENNSDSDFKERADSILVEFIDTSYKKYLNQEESYDNTLDYLRGVKFYGEEVTTRIKQVGEIDNSRTVYLDADKAFQKGDYQEALRLYRRVIEKDANNYSIAQQQIDTCINKMRVQAKDDISELIAVEDYAEVVKKIRTIPKDILDDELLEIKSNAITRLVTEAEICAADGDYTKAIATLTDVNGILIDSSLANNVKNYRIEKLLSLKSSINVKYDNINKTYSISSRKLDNISKLKLNIESGVTFENGFPPLFFLTFQFVNKYWIFTDEITIDCGKMQFTLPVDYFDLQTVLGYGNIVEFATFMHDENIEGNIIQNLKPIVDAMKTAEKVTIRFSGQGYKDVTIPTTHIEEICKLWDVYEILGKDFSLFSYLT